MTHLLKAGLLVVAGMMISLCVATWLETRTIQQARRPVPAVDNRMAAAPPAGEANSRPRNPGDDGKHP